MAHIVGAELGFYGVTKYALDRNRSSDEQPAAIPENAWDALLGEDEVSIDAILDGPMESIQPYYQALHERILLEFTGINDEESTIPSIYWEGYEFSLRFRLGRFDSHLHQHIVQMEKTLVGFGHAPTRQSACCA